MMTSESIFVNGNLIGRIAIDTNSQEIAFLPAITPSKLPMQDWESIDQLRNAVITTYQNKDNA
ncbi:hypothetical protein ACFL1J_06755 [Pseudomonadota bacterium]